MSERRTDHWLSIALSMGTHAVVVAALVWGYWHYKHPAPQPQQLAIEATVVDASRLPPGTLPSRVQAPEESAPAPAAEPAIETVPEPVPEPAPEPEPRPKPEVKPVPPKPAADVVALKAAQRKADEQRAKLVADARQKAAADRTAKLKAEKEKAEKEKAEKEKAEQDKVARALAAKEESDRKAREQAAAREKEAADRQTAQRKAELQARLAAEEHFAAAQASGQLAQYQAQIRARIERAWIRPASAKPGLSCEVHITQVTGGEVVVVQVGSCNGDETVRQSIEAAALRASPLPQPPDPALFDRNLVVTFKPQD